MRHTFVLAFLLSLTFLSIDRGPLIDPDGRGFSIDPNGGRQISAKSRGTLDPDGGTTNVDAGCAMDPNGCSGRNVGARIDDNG